MRPHVAALLCLALPLSALPAQGWIDEVRPVGPTRSDPAVVRVDSDVRMVLDGRVARIEVTERFRNTGRGIAEGTYHYPLPGEAVFSNFSLFQGEQELRGEMMSAEEARTIYEGIVRRLKDPALITLVGHGLIRAQVFPIQPGETRTVVLRYTQVLARDGDALRLRYAAGQRGAAPVTVSLRARGAAQFATAYSPTHPISESRRDGELHVAIDGPASGDVDIVLPLRRGLVGGTVLTHAQPGEDGFALLFLAPPPAGEESTVARDLTFVVDVSGSMSGAKIDQARRALHQALASLRAGDRFRLIAFSNAVRHFREGFATATPANLAEARRFVDGLAATGGTNLAGAIDAALAGRADPEHLALVFLLTDGLPSVGEREPDRIAANAAASIGRSRVFTVGVGHDVNTYLLDRLAVEGRGSAAYVAPGADVADAVGGVLAKLSHPALTDLRIVRAPVEFIDHAPAVLPDLFYGEELVILTRYRGAGSGPVIIEGTRDGRRQRFAIEARFARQEAGNDYVPQLWATRRVGELARQVRLEGATRELIDRIRDLGLRYGILTEYTSYLVQEPELLARRESAPLPQSAPALSVGANAFEDASVTTGMTSSKTLAAADQVVANRAAQMARREGSERREHEVRRAGGRLFAWRDGAWTDLGHRRELPVTTVAPFSKAYFEVVAASPALRERLAVGTPVIVAGGRASLRVADSGIAEWRPSAMARFLKEFEGR